MTSLTGTNLPTDIKLAYVPYSPDHASICSIARPAGLDLSAELPGKKVVIVAAPGAFTPTCTERHIPAFVKGASQLKAKGVDEVLVLTANDPFVLAAWGKALGNTGDYIKFTSDPKAAFSAKLGLAKYPDSYLPARTLRYAIIVDNGVIKYVGVEQSGSLDKSTIEAVLKHLD